MYEVLHSFLWLTDVPLDIWCSIWIYDTLFIHPLMDTWVVSIFWLLWIMLLQTFVYKVLCGSMFSILLHLCVGVELLGHNSMSRHLRNCQTVFQNGYTIFYLHQQCIRGFSNFSTFSLTLVIFWLILVILHSSGISWRFWFAFLW